MTTNRKKILLPDNLARAGWDVLQGRDDIEAVAFSNTIKPEELRAILGDAVGIALSATPFGAAELDAATRLEVVARIGVGYDAVEVPALTRRRVPLFVSGTANSVSVAEKAMFLMLTLAKRGATMEQVEKQFGAPANRHAAVGGGSQQQPPITRWDYSGFSVFFEHDRVIDSVVTGGSMDSATPATASTFTPGS